MPDNKIQIRKKNSTFSKFDEQVMVTKKIIGAENKFGELSSNISLTCCIHFYIKYPWGKHESISSLAENRVD